MSKPDGIPDDVWGMTEKIRNQPYHWKGPMEVAIIVAHAIMAERERCIAAITSMAIPHYMALGTVNGARRKIDPNLSNVEFILPDLPTVQFVLREPE